MPGIRQTLSRLKAFRGNRTRLITENGGKQPHDGSGAATRLHAQSPDGVNAGNLGMYVHVPENLSSNPPLVVALHGCGQTAFDYEQGTGWSKLADRHGFMVLYPEQHPTNNANRCFSWFQPGDIGRDLGEAQSIHEMVEHAISNFGIDRQRVFITGLSAGGAMAAVMLATYPEVYASGAIIAGLPYGSAHSVQEAFKVMFNDQQSSARTLGDRVRAASRHQGPWPRVSVWHGTADSTVKPSNAENLVKQWANVHRLSREPSKLETLGPHSRRIWEDVDGTRLIEAISVVGMGHGVPLASPTSPDAYGVPGPFFLDVGLSSTAHIADYFGCASGVGAASFTRWSGPDTLGIQGEAGRPDGHYQAGSRDPNAVIAAAFQSAGLPPPTGTLGRRGVDPKAIIEATLKAAGLRRT